jgi:hypothetical protein
MWLPMEQPIGHLRQPPSMEVVLFSNSVIDTHTARRVMKAARQVSVPVSQVTLLSQTPPDRFCFPGSEIPFVEPRTPIPAEPDCLRQIGT